MYLALPALFVMTTGPHAIGKTIGMMLGVAFFCVVAVGDGGALRFVDFVPCFLSGVFAYTLRRHSRARLHPAGWVIFILAVLAAGSAAAVRWWPQQVQIGWIAGGALGGAVFLFRDSD